MILAPLSIVHHVGRSLKYGSQSPRHGQRSAILKTPSFLGMGPFQAFLLSSMETTERPVLVIGIDDSSHSFYALEWTLDHFFSSPQTKPFKLVIVYARPPASSVVGFAGPGLPDIIAHVDSDLKKAAARIVDKAKQMCNSKSVEDVTVSVMEGDARSIICDAVNMHHASILVVGSHGYGALKRAVLGSVSDYCAHHAHCTVMIVKKPKY